MAVSGRKQPSFTCPNQVVTVEFVIAFSEPQEMLREAISAPGYVLVASYNSPFFIF